MRIVYGTILAAAVAATALGDSLGNIGDVPRDHRIKPFAETPLEPNVSDVAKRVAKCGDYSCSRESCYE